MCQMKLNSRLNGFCAFNNICFIDLDLGTRCVLILCWMWFELLKKLVVSDRPSSAVRIKRLKL